MKELLGTITEATIYVFTEMIPQLANAAFGALGNFTSAIGISKAIFAIILGLIGICLKILSKKNR